MFPLDATTVLEIQRERQKWTERPCATGFYWLRGWGDALLDVEMVLVSDDCLWFTPWGSDSDYEITETTGMWSGPLVPPSC